MTPIAPNRLPRVLIGAGIIAGVGVLIAKLFGDRATSAAKDAVSGAGSTTFPIHATGYWPFTARPDEVQMEGGTKDRKGNPLYTLEMFQAGQAPFVSVSGDLTIFPYGQRISIAEWPGVIFRITDTGSHFHGAGKVYRVAGREPLDICVQSSSTKVVANTDATIFPGDHFDKPSAAVAVADIGKPPTVVGMVGIDIFTAGAHHART